VKRYNIFAIFSPRSALKKLAALGRKLALGDQPSLIVLADSRVEMPQPFIHMDIAAAAKLWSKLDLADDIQERLNVPLLAGEAVLVVRGVGEDAIASLGAELDRILSGTRDRPLHLLRVGPQSPIAIALPQRRPRQGHRERAAHIAFAPSSETLVSTSADGRAIVWSLRRRAEVVSFPVSSTLTALAVSPDGTYVVADDWSELAFYSLADGTSWSLDRRSELVWSNDSRFVAVVNHKKDEGWFDRSEGVATLRIDHSRDIVEVWSVADRAQVLSVPGSSVAFLAADEIVVSDPPSRNETPSDVVRIVRIPSGDTRLHFMGRLPVVFPDGRSLLTHAVGGTGGATAQAHRWDAETGSRLADFNVHKHAWWREPGYVSPDGTLVAFPDDGKAGVFDARSGRRLFGRAGHGLTFSPDAESIGGVTDFEDPHVVVFSAHTGKKRLQQPGGLFAFAPDGQIVAVSPSESGWTSGDPTVSEPAETRLYRIADGADLGRIKGDSAVFSPRSDVVATAFDDGRIALWRSIGAKLLGFLGNIRVLSREVSGPKRAAPPAPEEEAALRVARYIDARYPSAATAGEAFAIAVALRLEAPERGAESRDLLPTHDAEGRPTGAPPVQVRLRASGAFEVLGDDRVAIDVPEKHVAPAVEFKLRPHPGVHGPQEVVLVFAQVPDVLGSLRLVIEVREVEKAPQIITATFRSAPKPEAGAAPAPDAIITVTRTRCDGRDALSYSYEWRSRKWRTVDAGVVELESSARAWASKRYAELSKFARLGRGHRMAEAEASLAQIGENIYRQIVPPKLGEFFVEFMPKGGSLLIYTNEPWLPWEIVKPWHADLDAQYSDFLCARVELVRWYFSPEGRRPASQILPQWLVAALSIGNLPAVLDEWHYLETLPAAWPPLQVVSPPISSGGDIVRLLERGQVGILHFATHGLPQSDGLAVAAMRFGGSELTVDELVGSELARGVAASAPLVFMNACHSGRRDVDLTRPDGWADRFLELGAAAFVGANWEVQDALARTFACTFYGEIKSGATLARAVLQARQSIRNTAPGNSTWLAYSLYSDPGATVQVARED
jgi:WD40 repeat protein